MRVVYSRNSLNSRTVENSETPFLLSVLVWQLLIAFFFSKKKKNFNITNSCFFLSLSSFFFTYKMQKKKLIRLWKLEKMWGKGSFHFVFVGLGSLIWKKLFFFFTILFKKNISSTMSGGHKPKKKVITIFSGSIIKYSGLKERKKKKFQKGSSCVLEGGQEGRKCWLTGTRFCFPFPTFSNRNFDNFGKKKNMK